MKAAVVFVCVLASGCAASQKEVHPLTRRASFDFSCPADQLRYYELSKINWGVKGCNKQATYVQSCQAGECAWVLNGMVETTPTSSPGASQ